MWIRDSRAAPVAELLSLLLVACLTTKEEIAGC